MNKPLFFPILLGLFVLCTFLAKAQPGPAKFPIIPDPDFLEPYAGSFQLNRHTVLLFDTIIMKKDVAVFTQQLNNHSGFALAASTDTRNPIHYIWFTIDTSFNVKESSFRRKEGYRLSVAPNHIQVKAADIAGLFYGLQSLIQLIKKSPKGNLSIPACIVQDAPRFAYRGMHLDVSRHMFPVRKLKEWIDLLSLYKINTFHWHLTDDQGWRIEIKKYPALQTVAAYRKETIIGHKRANPHVFDGQKYGGYYTQDEIKEVVKYATDRHINVIPEIDMPGHAQAVLAAYPKLGCTGGAYETATFWGVFEDVFCAGKEETFNFLTDVMDEILPLFPSAYIHIGGDECPKTRWKVCPDCQKRMKAQGLKDEHELQSYFIRRMERYLQDKGRKVIGWDEILEGGLAPSATVMSWTGLEGGIAAAKMKHDVIMTPEKYVYLDYYQSHQETEQIAAGGFTPLSKIYGYEPVPEVLNEEEAKYIKGVQANVWSEYLNTPEKAEYMMFPRVIALAEIAWTQKNKKNYAGFLDRLRTQEKMLEGFKINRFKNYDEVMGSTQFVNGALQLSLQSSLPKGIIRYSTNGENPNAQSPTYKQALQIRDSQQIRAAVFRKDTMIPPVVFGKDFSISKSTGKKIRFRRPPKEGYAPEGGMALVNGVSGSKLYNDGEWTGFSGEDMEVVIDLEKEQEVSLLGINILKYHWQRMWEPQLLKFEVSTDDKNYIEVYRQNSFEVEGINQIRAKIASVMARYIKVTAISKGIIPEGAYGAGGKAWLLADEIFVH
uniref:glycoside hydrolase family 20 protein n=1 Tax=Pedobacter schmidteae TaxID=2201271 RepID=UPI000EB42F14|nr:family 20 glycosylhydrolase [Pedobacter schmidteae]